MKDLGKIEVDCQDGTVGFGSGLHGWAFTLKQFADLLSSKMKIDSEKLMKKLWGDWCFIKEEKKWKKTQPTSDYARGFCQYVLDPIYKVSLTDFEDCLIFQFVIRSGLRCCHE